MGVTLGGVDETDGATTSSGGDTDLTLQTPLETAGSDGWHEHCGESQFVFEPVAPNVVLLLDKSGSMMQTWDAADTQVTRWFSLHAVVQALVEALDGSVNFGAKLFPETTAENSWEAGCGVSEGMEVPVAPRNAAAILAGIPGADDSVEGGTPATIAMQEVLAHLEALDPAQPRAIVLITDGAANCVAPSNASYDPRLNDAIEAAFIEEGIPTYVVGIGVPPGTFDAGVDLYEQLNDAAVRGGVPKDDPNERFYSALDDAALSDALLEIGAALISCEVILDPSPDYPDFVELEIDGIEIPRVDDCSQDEGWAYTDEHEHRIVLCGETCDVLRAGGRIDAAYQCPPAG